MRLKFSYSVEITQRQFKCEVNQLDEGYISGSEMVKIECKICQKFFDPENIKMHMFACERRAEKGRRQPVQVETLAAKSGFLRPHSGHNKLKHNFFPRVKFKRVHSTKKNTLSRKPFQNLHSQLPLDFGYEE